ncbi:MAG TPA: molybdopterin-dependent oxidoreductase [Mycobacteriales bacterium]|nr:molybdopterin-dependent oxidoreductase [Mycobacteriales bacterium]
MGRTAQRAREQAAVDPPPARALPDRAWAALSGVLAAAVSLGFTELLAAGSDSVPSLVKAVGGVVIDAAPIVVTEWAIQTFGRNDKTVLLAGVLILALVFGALLGVAARRDMTKAAAGFGAFALLGVLAARQDPLTAVPWTVVVAAVGALVGVGALAKLLAAATPRSGPRQPGVGQPKNEPGTTSMDRRRFLSLAAVIGVVAVGAATAGRAVSDMGRAAVMAARAALRLPAVVAPLPPIPAGATLAIPGLTPLVTSNTGFYRIDTALEVPRVDPDTWTLTIDGMVDRPLRLTLADLMAMPQVEADITIACVSNEVGGDLIGSARWQGVRLADLLDKAGVQPGATQLASQSVDGWTCGFPTEAARDGREALVAIGMNGELLPLQHGFPARLVVPGLYGYVSSTKWLSHIRLTTLEDFDGYWVPRGWSKLGPIKIHSRIDVPDSGTRIPAGRTPIAGVAWAQRRGIATVEVQVDDEPWVAARLSDEVGVDMWRQWVVEWDATPGEHRIAVRTTDRTGEVQTAERRDVMPDGATGHHTVQVRVT